MRGDGRIYLRGRRWWIEFYHRGKPIRESAGRTEGEAKKRLKERRRQILSGQFVAPENERLTVAELLDAYLVNRKVKRVKSYPKLAAEVRRMKGRMAGWRVVDVRLTTLNAFVNEYTERGFKPASVKVWLGYLASAFNIGRREGLTRHRPDFPQITIDNARQGFFEPDEFARVAAQLTSPVREVVTFAYLTGWRQQEVLGLTWAEVDRAGGAIRLPSQRDKTSRGRGLPLVGRLGALIDERWRARVVTRPSGETSICPWVFHRKGREVKDYYTAWHGACRRAGVGYKIPHDFRRSMVKDQIEAGVPKRIAKENTGHASDAVFDRYHIVDLRPQAEALTALESHRARRLNPDNTRTIGGAR